MGNERKFLWLSFIYDDLCFACLLFLYFNSVAIRSYYLYKYMDKFRQKFGVAEAEWYGQKYKP